MKVSNTRSGYSETYLVKFWYCNEEGFDRQATKEYFSNSKQCHDLINKLALKELKKLYTNPRIISVIYV